MQIKEFSIDFNDFYLYSTSLSCCLQLFVIVNAAVLIIHYYYYHCLSFRHYIVYILIFECRRDRVVVVVCIMIDTKKGIFDENF